MSMNPCAKCFENYWSFHKIEDIVQATCQLCGHEVEFPVKRKKPHKRVLVTHIGDSCKKCNTPVIKRIPKHKPERLMKQDYYFDWYLYCPHCRTMYMVEEAKREIKDLGILDKFQMLKL